MEKRITLPLTEELEANPELTKKVFGRYFTSYAKKITETATQKFHGDRYYWINCMADSNIEFRLNRFTSGKQYQNLMKNIRKNKISGIFK